MPLLKTARVAAAIVAVSAACMPTLTPNAANQTHLSPQVALDWNANAVDAVRAALTMDGVPAGSPPRHIYQPEGILYMAYVQAAVYDATMKISHRYALYHRFHADGDDASTQAAVIEASYRTLIFYLGSNLLPADKNTLTAKYTAALAALPAGEATARGVAVGKAAAMDIEAFRANDGRNAPVSDACLTPTAPPTPGVFLCPPPPSVQALQVPWLASMKPFLLSSASAFRAPAPPALNSPTYLDNLQEVRAFGSSTSTVRTADQTATAYFWNANVINQVNQTLRDTAVQHHMDLVDTVRLLAMGDMVPADAAIACWDSKYHYLYWRPVTAIRADGNPADATWTPLLATPTHPEYPSAHGCISSALAEVLATALGTRDIDVTVHGAQTGATTLTTTRTFDTVKDFLAEVVNARVWIGFHYRNSVIVAEKLGTSVGDWVLDRNFQRNGDHED